MTERRSRRDFLRVLGPGLGVVVAGCQSSEERPTDDESSPDETTDEKSDETTEDESDESTEESEEAQPDYETPVRPDETVVYRVNAGDEPIDSLDDGPDWTPPSATDGVTVTPTEAYGADTTVALDDSVPESTPPAVFSSELWSEDGFQFSFDVTQNATYEVRLYVAEIYHGSTGERLFDATVEGSDFELDDYDIVADVDAGTGVMKSGIATASDDALEVAFEPEIGNPKVSAIEVVRFEPHPNALGPFPETLEFGPATEGDDRTATITLRNAGAPDDDHPDVTVESVAIAGADTETFSHDVDGEFTLAPGETRAIEVSVTQSDSSSEPTNAILEIVHSGTNSPLGLELLAGERDAVPVEFSTKTLQGFQASDPTALAIGPDGRLYVAGVDGWVYALEVERTDGTYRVVHEEEIDAIRTIPNHDDHGTYRPDEADRQVTGLTVGGTASVPVVYVSSSDPSVTVGPDDGEADTNSGAISRLTLEWETDGALAALDHEVVVFGLPRSTEQHTTNGLVLDDGTLYVAQGGHTNKGAPSENFGYTPEYALSGAILSIDVDRIDDEYDGTSLRTHDPNGSEASYPDLTYLYAVPTVAATPLPFGGESGRNMGTLVPDGPVTVYSPGYRNPYDVTMTGDGRLYTADNGSNPGWGGSPVDDDGELTGDGCTNRPNESGDFRTEDELHLVTDGAYGGHPNPIRANPDGAGLYDPDGTRTFDFDASNTPVPFDAADHRQCEYRPSPGHEGEPGVDGTNGSMALFNPTGGLTTYTASNFDEAMRGDLLVVELFGTINRVRLNDAGDEVSRTTTLPSAGGALGITAQGDDDPFPGTIWTANYGGDDVSVLEPADYTGQ